jgi:YHS domain-containing protein
MVGEVPSTIVDGLSFAFQMAWEVWWALILGFLLSGIVQAWFTRRQMERLLGGRGSITERGITFNYTAVLNIVFTLVGGALVWLTVRRGYTDPVCGMRVDRYQTPHQTRWQEQTVYFCSIGCKESFDADPDA